MIIIGYPGVGKSTASNSFTEVIDFDFQGDYEIDYYTYCMIAEGLSKAGYIVCTTSHKEVMDYFTKSKEQVAVCYPHKDLKSFWITELRKRYVESNDVDNDKNYKAYMRALNHFDNDIKYMSETGFDNIELPKGIYLSSVFQASNDANKEKENENETLIVDDNIIDINEAKEENKNESKNKKRK